MSSPIQTPTAQGPSLRKLALQTLLGSIALAAALGCFAILASDLGWFGVRVLLTSITVSAASILIMACGAALESSRPSRAARPGIVLALVAAGLWILGVWAEPSGDTFWKCVIPVTAFAIVAAHGSLLSFARLTPALQSVRYAAAGLAGLLALLVTVMTWGELDSDGYLRTLGVLSILAAAASIAVPVCHRLSRDKSPVSSAARVADGALAPHGYCPRCGAAVGAAAGAPAAHDPGVAHSCGACHASYRVVFAESHELVADLGGAGSLVE